jgi:hypothetical protein
MDMYCPWRRCANSKLSFPVAFSLATAFIPVDNGTQIYLTTAWSWLVGPAYVMDLIRGPLDRRDMFGMVFPAALLATVSFCADCTIYPGYTISSLDGRLGGCWKLNQQWWMFCIA